MVDDLSGFSEIERAAHYALLARLFGAPPDAELMRRIGALKVAEATVGSRGAKAWGWLRREAGQLPLTTVGAEYWALFAGKAPAVDLFGSSYGRAEMAAGLAAARDAAAHRQGAQAALANPLPDDHFAVVCATMQALIEGIDDLGPAPVTLQQLFFSHHIAPWFEACCRVIRQCPIAEFYRIGAEWTEAFLQSEQRRLRPLPV